MDTRGFDNLIKDSLSDFSKLPKKEVKRAVFGIIFFQNLWVFHKLKFFGALFLVTGIAVSSIYFFDENENNSIVDQYVLGVESPSMVLDVLAQQDLNEPIQSNELVVNKLNNLESESIPLNDLVENEIFSNEADLKEVNVENELPFKERLENSNNNIKHSKVHAIEKSNIASLAVENNTSIPAIVDVLLTDSKQGVVNINSAINPKHQNNLVVPPSKTLEATLDNKGVNKLLKINSKNIVALHTCTDSIEINSVPVISQNDYANNKLKRGLTIDAYFSPYNRADVDNVFDPAYQDYWWDFYKEYDMESSGVSMGLNISYNIKNFKINTGFSHSQIFDNKPVYDYHTEIDSVFTMSTLGESSLLSVEYVTGLQVYGQDTAIILYVDPNDTQLLSEINESSNRYNYLKIPLTIGYELSFNRFSIEINGGIEYSRLVKYSGISYKNGYVDVGVRKNPYYYYSDLVATTYGNNLEALKVNNWNYVANAVTRIRLTPSFDLYTAFNFQYQDQNIMNDSYLLEKTYTKYGVNIGATYYLNPRLSLKSNETPKFD